MTPGEAFYLFVKCQENIKLNLDNETWLIDYGDELIEKKSEQGFNGLSDLEKIVYCLWVIDSIRNSGTLDVVEEIFSKCNKQSDYFSC